MQSTACTATTTSFGRPFTIAQAKILYDIMQSVREQVSDLLDIATATEKTPVTSFVLHYVVSYCMISDCIVSYVGCWLFYVMSFFSCSFLRVACGLLFIVTCLHRNGSTKSRRKVPRRRRCLLVYCRSFFFWFLSSCMSFSS